MAKGYSLTQYAMMVNCEPRMGGYAKALKAAITPGCTVLDVGAGFGIFSLLACENGAGHVVAIEPDDSVELLRTFASDNGFEDRISIVQDLSSNYHPAAKADVIVSDLRGALPHFEGHIEAIIDARQRLLAPGGKLIPERDILRAAIANVTRLHRTRVEPWLSSPYDLDLSSGHSFVVNETSVCALAPSDLLSAPEILAQLDYRKIETSSLDAVVDLAVQQDGKANGIAVWFDADLYQGLGFSNAPGSPGAFYQQTFFPFEQEIDMRAGDRIGFALKAKIVDGKYIWSWTSSIYDQALETPRDVFRHSTFKGRPIPRDAMSQRSSAYIPLQKEAQAIDQFCLSNVDGKRTLEDIAALAIAAFPAVFRSPQSALDHVTKLMARYL